MRRRIALARRIGHARFLPFGVRDRIIRFLTPPHARIDHEFVVSVGLAKIAGNLNNYIDWSIYNFGQYEPGILKIIYRWRSLLGSNRIFWDVGANCGQHSLFAASIGYAVESFEPLPEVREKFLISLALNPNLLVNVHPFGLGHEHASLPFVKPNNENFGTGHFDEIGDIVLPLRPGDDLQTAPPSLIKIDVEGYEGEVLRGLATTLMTARPAILCEFSERTRLREPNLLPLIPEKYLAYEVRGNDTIKIVPFEGRGLGEMAVFLPEESAPALLASLL